MENISNLLSIERTENYDLIFEFGLPKHWILMDNPVVNKYLDRSNEEFTVYKFNYIQKEESINDNEVYNIVINHVNKIFNINKKIDKELEENNKRIEKLKDELLNEFNGNGE